MYCHYVKSANYLQINNSIELLQRKIKKYNKVIEENKKANKHLNEYDLLILNGKYTRKVLKEKKNLEELMDVLREENKYDYFIHTWDALISFFSSKNTIMNVIRTQICMVVIFLLLTRFANRNFEVPCLRIHSNLWFRRNFRIASTGSYYICQRNDSPHQPTSHLSPCPDTSHFAIPFPFRCNLSPVPPPFVEPCSSNMLTFLYGYNTAHLFISTMRQNISSLFIKPKKKKKMKEA
ncbi:hypothetical protein POVCU2_0027170 [Plasmodium ovale curtisi]|uniref:Uncharacterized protein n=1 Tax=Plasmodium ovale curtisi TaxID=864141 RepID=A0A1A8W0H5_PLAOA|nr:hypothetical protein POVCU2_0027170 [Plasmodium ovale curtisi]SBS93212.1 hypothetical protein POVCU1_024930 [Plasmodium ovale curtisi]